MKCRKRWVHHLGREKYECAARDSHVDSRKITKLWKRINSKGCHVDLPDVEPVCDLS